MKVLRVLWILAYAAGAVTYPVTAVLAQSATEAVFLIPAADEMVKANQEMIEAGLTKVDKNDVQSVGRIYGNVQNEGKPIPVLFVPGDRFLRPGENPSFIFLKVDKQKGENPLQVQTLWFFAPWFTGGFAGGGTLLLLLWIWRRRKAASLPAAIAARAHAG